MSTPTTTPTILPSATPAALTYSLTNVSAQIGRSILLVVAALLFFIILFFRRHLRAAIKYYALSLAFWTFMSTGLAMVWDLALWEHCNPRPVYIYVLMYLGNWSYFAMCMHRCLKLGTEGLHITRVIMVLATIAKVAVPVAMISSLRGARVSPTSPTLCITVIAPNMILAERVTNCIVDFIMTVIFLSQITRGFSRDLVFHDLMRKLFGDIGLATTISFTGELVSIIALYFVSLASFTGAINPLYYGFTIVACLVYALAAIDMKVTAATRNRLDTPVMMKKEPVSIALGNLSTRSGDFNVSAVAGSGVPTLNARNNVSGGSGNSVLNATTDERMWDLER